MASALVLATILIGTISSTIASDFPVGGRDGWVQNPKESYSNWSSRLRFQVNDKLVFKYNKDQDSVLVVKKEDYDSCNTNSPTQKLEGGDSAFQFTRSGPFYFISGVSDRCSKGEKLAVVVIAPRNKKPLPPPLPPSASPPSISPLPSPAKSPSSSSSPSLSPPSVAPAPSPSSSSPSASPASALSPSSSPSASPASAPTPSPSASPAITPTLSPSTSPSASPATTPAPSSSSATSPPSSSEVSPAASPPKSSTAASALTASTVTIGLYALVLSHVILG